MRSGKSGFADEVAAEGDEIGVALLDDGFRGPGLEPTGRHDPALEDRAQVLGCDRRLTLRFHDAALHAGFDDVQIGEAETIEFLGHVVEQTARVTVAHAVPAPVGPDPDGRAVAAEDRGHGFGDLKKQAGAVLDGAAVGVGPLVAAVLQELVDEVAVRAVQFGAVEAGRLGPFGRATVVLDDAGDLARLPGRDAATAGPTRRASR